MKEKIEPSWKDIFAKNDIPFVRKLNAIPIQHEAHAKGVPPFEPKIENIDFPEAAKRMREYSQLQPIEEKERKEFGEKNNYWPHRELRKLEIQEQARLYEYHQKTLQENMNWISIEEKLPTDQQEVLFVVYNPLQELEVKNGIFCNFRNHWQFIHRDYTGNNRYMEEEVMYWMPLIPFPEIKQHHEGVSSTSS